MQKPEVGQKLYVIDCGNAARHGKGRQRECMVNKVGRKFFYVVWCDNTYHDEGKFNISDRLQASNYSASLKLYDTKKDYEDEKNAHQINRAIAVACGSFGRPQFSLSQLKSAAGALGLDIKLI